MMILNILEMQIRFRSGNVNIHQSVSDVNDGTQIDVGEMRTEGESARTIFGSKVSLVTSPVQWQG